MNIIINIIIRIIIRIAELIYLVKYIGYIQIQSIKKILTYLSNNNKIIQYQKSVHFNNKNFLIN